MNPLCLIARRVRGFFQRKRLEQEMAEEMRAHLALQTQENIARGLPPSEAHYAAQRAFGGMEQIKERCLEQRSGMWLEQFMQDVRFAVRSLRRNPGFAMVAVFTLGLGIGANTAIFNVVRAVMLKPLGYPESAQLVTVLHPGAGPVSPGDFFDWREQSRSFAGMALRNIGAARLRAAHRRSRSLGFDTARGCSRCWA